MGQKEKKREIKTYHIHLQIPYDACDHHIYIKNVPIHLIKKALRVYNAPGSATTLQHKCK